MIVIYQKGDSVFDKKTKTIMTVQSSLVAGGLDALSGGMLSQGMAVVDADGKIDVRTGDDVLPILPDPRASPGPLKYSDEELAIRTSLKNQYVESLDDLNAVEDIIRDLLDYAPTEKLQELVGVSDADKTD